MTNEKVLANKRKKPTPLSSPLDALLGYHLRRASAAMQAQLSEGYSKLGFRITEASILIMIESNPGIKQSEIGQALEIKSANMAPLVAFLDENDYVERMKLDGRSQGLHLSNKGKRMAKKLWTCIDENESWLLSHLPDVNRDAILQGLKNIWSE
ncbi:MAG: MarR family transcriptional regulator [Spongiibacteraceae bacterium]|nr:MarR family transcriptional regulator [Spongiibacteraceae bacterium]